MQARWKISLFSMRNGDFRAGGGVGASRKANRENSASGVAVARLNRTPALNDSAFHNVQAQARAAAPRGDVRAENGGQNALGYPRAVVGYGERDAAAVAHGRDGNTAGSRSGGVRRLRGVNE